MWSLFETLAVTLPLRSDIVHGTALEDSAVDESQDQPTGADRLFHAVMGRFTASILPTSLALAYADWWVHLSQSPGKQ